MRRFLYLTFMFGILALFNGCSEKPSDLISASGEDQVQLDDANGKTTSGNQTTSTATINTGTYEQYIRGFGGASLRGWIDDLTSYQAMKAFDKTNGIGLSVLRVRVPYNSSDFAAERTTIDLAKSYGAIVIASAWTAPPSMKNNNNIVGGQLNTSSYADYAAHLSAFCTAVGGVTAISPINEPNISVSYESMELTASEVAAFVADQGENCGADIMAPEPYNMSYSYISNYLNYSTAARSKTTYVCGHIYGATPTYYNYGKEVWMTEHITDTDDANTWSGAFNTATEIHDCMVAGYSMWTWWYIRRYYGLIDESSAVTKRGYVVAQFAKFIRPGYYRVDCDDNPTNGVYVTAYTDGSTLVVVAINENSSTTYQPFYVNGISISGFTRYKTSSSLSLSSDSFSSGSSFGINLPASSVTTLISW